MLDRSTGRHVLGWLLVVLLSVSLLDPVAAQDRDSSPTPTETLVPVESTLPPPTVPSTSAPTLEPTLPPMATSTAEPTPEPTSEPSGTATATAASTATAMTAPTPTLTPTATATTEPTFSAAGFWYLDFDQDTYSATAGSTLTITLTLFLEDETDDGQLFVLLPGFLLTVQDVSVLGVGAQCGALAPVQGNLYGATIRGSGPGSCDYAITVRIDDSVLPGMSIPVVASARSGDPVEERVTSAIITVPVPPPPAVTFDQASYSGLAGSTIDITVTVTTFGRTNRGSVLYSVFSPQGSSISAVNVTSTGSMSCSGNTFSAGNSGGTCTYVISVTLGPPRVFTIDDTFHFAVGTGTTLRNFARTIDIQIPPATGREFLMGASDLSPAPGQTVTITLILRGNDVPPGDLAGLSSSMPTGATLVGGSPAATCTPACLLPPSVLAVGPMVLTSGALPAGGTLTLTYQLLIPEAATPGTNLTVGGTGSVFGPPTVQVGTASLDLVVAAPIDATGTTIAVPSGGSGSGQVTATGGSGPITFALQDPALKGTATVLGDGSFQYQAAPGASGTDTFTVLATDGSASDVATVTAVIATTGTLGVSPLILPVSASETVTVDLAGQVTGGEPPYTFALTTEPTQGTAAVSREGILTFTARATASGADALTYTVTDNAVGVTAAATATGTVVIVITAPGSSPTPTATVEPGVTPSPTATSEPGITPSPPATVDPGTTPTIDPDVTPTSAAGTGGGTETPAGPQATEGRRGSKGGPITQLPSTGQTGATPALTGTALLVLALAAVAIIAAGALGMRARGRSR